jgi:hypothetical protein
MTYTNFFVLYRARTKPSAGFLYTQARAVEILIESLIFSSIARQLASQPSTAFPLCESSTYFFSAHCQFFGSRLIQSQAFFCIRIQAHVYNEQQIYKVFGIVGDPDPQDPHVFEPPGSGSIGQRCASGSGSFPFLMNVFSGLK